MSDPISSLHAAISAAVAALTGGEVPELALERPANADHGDYATSVAMRLAPMLSRKPREIAEELATAIATIPGVASVEIAGPGFINIRLGEQWYRDTLSDMLAAGADFGRRPFAPGVETLVEFVSSNPTGGLTIGSARKSSIAIE